ncbi:MAG: LysR family transcriptional regulator [Pseudomonadales bacterium]|nr:LysR family transcriptional regulator [Pseudomonadales bacterium]
MVQIRNTAAISWDLLESFLAIAEAKSIRQAAISQGVNHATLSRHLKKLEQHIGQPVFNRSNKGLALTTFGDTVYAYANGMAEQAQQLQFFLDHQGDKINGPLTISLGDSLMSSIAPAAKQLTQENPGLNVVFKVSNDLISLDKGEADIALRITESPPEHLIAIKLQDLAVAAYVQPQLLHEQGINPESLFSDVVGQLNWINWQRTIGDQDISDSIQQLVGAANIKYSVGSSAAMLDAVNAGLGAAFMLTHYIPADSGLIEIAQSRTPLPLKLWLLYHPHLRHSPKIRAAVQMISQHGKVALD